jgi:carboxypeptidase Taq
VAQVLAALRDELVPLVQQIVDSPRQPSVEVLSRSYAVDLQRHFGSQAAEKLGFDFSRGRLDTTAHPFCAEAGPDDCRLTTRFQERDVADGFFSILHEAGHGMYEQGLRGDWYGLPPGRSVSLGIHESQSRLWENMVGRSRAFWEHFYPQAQATFSEALKSTPLDAFYTAINAVRRSLIRTEADEATYNLHIFVRFELEQELIHDQLPVDDLPGAWRDRYRRYVGIQPPSDADGVLQDIHWSGGAFGYFPTYALGNLYAAQFFAQADRDLGGLADQFRRGEFAPLLNWLREKIHHRGQCYTAGELCREVTGQPLSPRPLIEYLRGKLGPIYHLP